jgi:Spy/CpxP family protein refolding chaperone
VPEAKTENQKENAMKTKRVVLVAVAALAVIGLLAGAGFAQHQMHNPKRAYEFMSVKVNSLLDDINATDAQRAQVNQMKDELWQQGQALHQTEQLREHLVSQWGADQVDAAKLHAAVNEKIDAFRAFANRAVDDSVKLHDLLTPEQRAKLQEEIRNLHQHHGHDSMH